MSFAGLDPFVLCEIALAGAAYLWAASRVPRWDRGRTGAFLGGLLALALALGPLDAAADGDLPAHMLQHLTLIFVAPPLLVAGAPLRIALAVLPAHTGRAIVRLIRRPALRGLLLPPVTLGVFAALILATHVPAFYGAALESPFLHGAEHLLYLGAGLLLWTAVLAPAPVPRNLSPLGTVLLLLLAMLPGAAVGLWLMTATGVVYDAYAHAGGAAAIDDQWAAGMLMWAGGSAVLSIAIVGLGWRALAAEETRQRIADARADRAEGFGPVAGGEPR